MKASAKSDLKIPAWGGVLRLVTALAFILFLISPAPKSPLWVNELRGIAGAACFLGFLCWWLTKNGLPPAELLLEGPGGGLVQRIVPAVKLLALYLVAFVLAVVLLDWLISAITSLWTSQAQYSLAFRDLLDAGKAQKDRRLLAALSGAPVYAVIKTVLLAPVWEELVFRRFIFAALRKKHGFAAALAGSSALFGLIHFPSVFMIAITALHGAALGYLFEKRRDLVANIVFHSLLNATVLLVLAGLSYR